MPTYLLCILISSPFILAAFVATILLTRRHGMEKQEEKRQSYFDEQNNWLLNAFDNFDCAVYGFRGSGKDVIFAHAINLKGGKHYSNIYYNEDTEVRNLKDLHVGGNTFYDLIDGTFTQFELNFEDGFHFFISDAGIYLGCQYNTELNKTYGELPVHLSLRRHLYNSHVHTNSQALNRPWDKVREQQGCFIHALSTTDCGDFLIVKAISYTKYESALGCLPPPEEPNNEHVMKYGEILEHKFLVPINSLTYDTRHFKTLLEKIPEGGYNENERASIIL